MDAYVPIQRTHTHTNWENFHYVPVVQTRSSCYKPNCSYWTFLTSRFDLMTRRRTYRRDVPSNPTLMNSAVFLFCWCHVALINTEMLTESIPPSQKNIKKKSLCRSTCLFCLFMLSSPHLERCSKTSSSTWCETFWDGSAAQLWKDPVSMKLLSM